MNAVIKQIGFDHYLVEIHTGYIDDDGIEHIELHRIRTLKTAKEFAYYNTNNVTIEA